MKSEDQKKFRTVEINQHQRVKYASNSISTTKYNLINFLPKFLLNQFTNYSNIFFLIISVVQQLPDVSPMGRYTTIIPLAFILTVTAVKELYEDVVRRREDKKVNARPVDRWAGTGWSTVPWRQVTVGELLRVKNNAEFPADLVMICGSDTASGIAYVETVNLDGESNLKVRRVPHTLNVAEENVTHLAGTIKCDQPNELIYSFNGVIVLPAPAGRRIPINEEQLLLRGAVLRNTDWIVGIAVYTGIDTKIWRNSQERELKRSSSADMVNWHMMVLFTIFFLLTICNSVLFVVYNLRIRQTAWYLPTGQSSGLSVSSFLTFAIGYSLIIPISLQVYLEIVRVVQANHINRDEQFYEHGAQTGAQARTSILNSDLGQVKYIFTDKTGTLTQNNLEFKGCSINGQVYAAADTTALVNLCATSNMCHHFFIAVCVIPGVIPIFDKNLQEWKYYSSSTDQLALITAAKKFGYELRQRTYRDAHISVNGAIQKYKILCDIDFTSERRRSSVVVETAERKIVLYSMGADDVIFQRLKQTPPEQALRAQTSEHLLTFALSGYRTMCLAMTELNMVAFGQWRQLFAKAKLSALTSRQAHIGRLAERIETNLALLGAVACEDKLQEEVPQTIATLMAAGIKVWMLTGDKQETAVNIGYATRLLDAQSTMFVLDAESIAELRLECTRISQRIVSGARQPALVVNGRALNELLRSDYADYFITLSMNCESVICCRMIPIDKARVVSYVQSRTKHVTLAIGDGANDVPMIQAACVGVGVSGVEGLQAVYAADYSIITFRHLTRLLLVHGTWNYDRICKVIFYIYYKSIPMCMTMFFVSYSSGWSGSSLFDDWAYVLYNVAFTDGATLALGALERNYPEQTLLADPSIYRRNDWFNVFNFYLCLLNAVYHSAMLLALTLAICNKSSLWQHAYGDSYIIQGNVLYVNILVVVLAKGFLHLMHWSRFAVLLALSSTLLWFPFIAIYNQLWLELHLNPDMASIATMLFSTSIFWLNVLFVPVGVLLVDIFFISLYRTFWLSESYYT